MHAKLLTSRCFDLEKASFIPPVTMGYPTDTADARAKKNRRLPERILVAVHQACDLGDLGVAAQLLSILDTAIDRTNRGRVDPAHRRLMEGVISAHSRLWHLRHPVEAVVYGFGGTSELAA